jgi:hypothetical protein
MTDEEKRIFDKYIRPGRRVLSRIKTWLKIKLRSPRIKTIKDVEYLGYENMMRVVCLIFIIFLIQVIVGVCFDVYYFFFPQARPQDTAGMVPYIIPMIANTFRGVLNVE